MIGYMVQKPYLGITPKKMTKQWYSQKSADTCSIVCADYSADMHWVCRNLGLWQNFGSIKVEFGLAECQTTLLEQIFCGNFLCVWQVIYMYFHTKMQKICKFAKQNFKRHMAILENMTEFQHTNI
jgi:hypothetical protein